MSLRLVSVNIERSKHLELVLPFLVQQNPDVVCLQELCEQDVARFEEALGMQAFFAPMMRNDQDGIKKKEGLGIFARTLRDSRARYYVGAPGTVPDVDNSSEQSKYATQHHLLALCDIEKDGEAFTIATTHFPWTPDGSASDFQREAMVNMLALLSEEKEFVLCGDFNAPRGGEIFAELAETYKDNVPPQYKTSLDLSLHRAAQTQPEQISNKMVDGLFSTPGYRVCNVEMICGVSDHCGLVADVDKAKRTA